VPPLIDGSVSFYGEPADRWNVYGANPAYWVALALVVIAWVIS
jgi:hypothetical protein